MFSDFTPRIHAQIHNKKLNFWNMVILVIDIFKDLSYVWKHWTEIV